MKTFLITLLLGSVAAGAAPLFPDVDGDHWARDAVARLAEAGLLEGYPDGTFKGDRASSRYEVALLVARLLQKAEQSQATFADKGQLELLRQLAQSLRQELEALGVRVENLEGEVGRIDERVQELERLTFYGSFESFTLTQTMVNRGGSTGAGLNTLDYNDTVGASAGPALRPQVHGIIPVVDYRNGRALVNGVGFTALARLGVKARLDQDSEAGLELAAFSSQGNTLVDTYWGVSAPYLANAWTANNLNQGVAQGQNNQPFSRAVFDHAWYEHKPSKTRITLGYYEKLRMDRFIYVGQSNNNAFGPARFGGFGIQALGQWDLGQDQELKYELFTSRFGDGGNLYQGNNYTHLVFGGDLNYRRGRADIQFNWVRFYDESPDSLPLTGLDNITNVAYLNSPGWSQTQWVNPPGHFANQRSAREIANTGAVQGVFTPNVLDSRPVAGWNGNADNALGITQGAGNFGSQAQTTYGASARYWIPLQEADGKEGIRLLGAFGHSDYKSNRNSSYISSGNLYRFELEGILDQGNLNFNLQAQSIDPNYNPALFNAALLGIRFVRPFNFIGRFHLHDSGAYPQNRQGLLFKGDYSWADRSFTVGWKAGVSQQTQTSLYDVRVRGGALGPAIPTHDVIGFAPGFFDPVFAGFAHPNIYGPKSGNSFDANLSPLENPRGHMQEWGLYFKHKMDQPRLSFDLALERNTYRRDSALSAAQGGSQNQVDLKTDYARLGLAWTFRDDWTLRAGSEVVRALGHHDPGGLYNHIAVARGQTNFINMDSTQMIPYLGLDVQMSPTSSWSLDVAFYNTRDRVDQHIPTGTSFSWSGPQVSSSYKLTF